MRRVEETCAVACGMGPCRGLCNPARGYEDMRRARALLVGLGDWLDAAPLCGEAKSLMLCARRALDGDHEARREYFTRTAGRFAGPSGRTERRAWRRVLRWFALASDLRV